MNLHPCFHQPLDSDGLLGNGAEPSARQFSSTKANPWEIFSCELSVYNTQQLGRGVPESGQFNTTSIELYSSSPSSPSTTHQDSSQAQKCPEIISFLLPSCNCSLLILTESITIATIVTPFLLTSLCHEIRVTGL